MSVTVRRILAICAAGLLAGCSQSPQLTGNACGTGPYSPEYRVEGQTIQFPDHPSDSTSPFAQVEGPDGSRFTLVEEVSGDLDQDGLPDFAAIIVMETGGSGSFYYLAASTRQQCEYQGVRGVFLGDRIRAQELGILPAGHIDEGMITFMVGMRTPSQPMATAPTLSVSRMYRLQGQTLLQVDPY